MSESGWKANSDLSLLLSLLYRMSTHLLPLMKEGPMLSLDVSQLMKIRSKVELFQGELKESRRKTPSTQIDLFFSLRLLNVAEGQSSTPGRDEYWLLLLLFSDITFSKLLHQKQCGSRRRLQRSLQQPPIKSSILSLWLHQQWKRVAT